jgi:hypothetical protein
LFFFREYPTSKIAGFGDESSGIAQIGVLLFTL